MKTYPPLWLTLSPTLMCAPFNLKHELVLAKVFDPDAGKIIQCVARILCFDNGGTANRYTVLYLDEVAKSKVDGTPRLCAGFAASEPTPPQGWPAITADPTRLRRLGKLLPFHTLPATVRQRVKYDLCEFAEEERARWVVAEKKSDDTLAMCECWLKQRAERRAKTKAVRKG